MRKDPFARLLFRDVVTKQARSMQWQTGTTKTRKGKASLFIWHISYTVLYIKGSEMEIKDNNKNKE